MGSERKRIAAALIVLVAITPASLPAAPQDPPLVDPPRPRYTVLRAAQPALVDGHLDDAVWAGPPTFELAYETRPGENIPPRVKTHGWVAFDDQNFYFAFRCFDPAPGEVRARYTDRDRAFQDDFVGVVLDTFDDERRAFEFFLNPLGVQMDLVQNDVTRFEDDSWDAIWSSAGRLTEEGWEVEAAIPLSSLRFPKPAQGSGTWGIDAVRMRPRGVRERIGLVPQQRGRNCYLCQEAKLDGFRDIEPGRDLELDPTVTSGRTDARDPIGGGDYETVDDDTEGGLTGRWGITPDLTLLGTLNPDFSQIEADAAQLDVNNQFALFYPEKRPFFLEGADYFDTDIDAVYTRNIADPAWGGKLTGKLSSNALGLVVAEDRITNLLLPGAEESRLATLDDENLSAVARYRRDLGATSTLGFLYTGREGDEYHNRVAGADLQWRPDDAQTLTLEALYSETAYPDTFAAEWDQPLGGNGGHAINAGYEYSIETFRGYAIYEDFAEDFRSDLGFEPRVDYRRGEVGAQRIWEGNGEKWYTRMESGGNVDYMTDQGGALLEQEVEVWWYAAGPLQSEFNFGLGGGTEVFRGLEVDDRFVFGYVSAQPTSWFRFYTEFVGKRGFDYANVRPGDELSISPGVRFDVGRHLRLTVDDRYEQVGVDGGTLFRANLVELRATWQFNVRMFVRVISQYFSIEREPALYTFEVDPSEEDLFNQFLFSYKINPQTVLFAGYSDTSSGTQSLDLTRESRTVFLKIGYAWRL